MSETLASVLEPVLGHPVVIDDLARSPGGASRETWIFAATGPDGSGRRLVLRRDPTGTPSSGLRLEGLLLSAARQVGVPVPDVLVVGDDSSELGPGSLVMAFVEGETIARRILRDDRFAEVRPLLAAQCGRALAAIHRIPAAEIARSGSSAPSLMKSGSGAAAVACEPVVSILTEVAKQLEPGRCVT